MSLTKREMVMYQEVKAWEDKLYSYEPTDLEMIYDKAVSSGFAAIPEEYRKEFLSVLDNMMFHLHALIQGSEFQVESRDRILSAARIFNEDIETIQDIKRLSADQIQYIAKQQIARHRMYAFAQGGVSGMGGAVLTAADLPALTLINLRLVQLIAMCYGYEVNTPKEMMISLKAFHAGAMPQRLHYRGFEELKEVIGDSGQSYFFDGDDALTDSSWFERPVKQVMKYMAVGLFRKKKVQGLPVVSMAIAAGSNYAMTKRVSEFAHHFYKHRYLQEKLGNQE